MFLKLIDDPYEVAVDINGEVIARLVRVQFAGKLPPGSRTFPRGLGPATRMGC